VAENPGVGSSSSIQVVQVGTSINIGHSHTRACTENQGALGDSEHYSTLNKFYYNIIYYVCTEKWVINSPSMCKPPSHAKTTGFGCVSGFVTLCGL